MSVMNCSSQDIIELEQEIDSIAPSVERGDMDSIATSGIASSAGCIFNEYRYLRCWTR